MNLYIRYFDSEVLVNNVNDALAFLGGISEIGMNSKIAADVREYFESNTRYPKRYKVRNKIYFIMIKTDANTMQEFKDYRNRSVNSANAPEQNEQQEAEPVAELPVAQEEPMAPMNYRERVRNIAMSSLQAQRFGWYEGAFDFKRVVVVPSTGKNEYRDTHFVVQCKAMSGMDCYNRIVDYLRGCVDSRSQFPSAKGKNFSFVYLGACKPLPMDE